MGSETSLSRNQERKNQIKKNSLSLYHQESKHITQAYISKIISLQSFESSDILHEQIYSGNINQKYQMKITKYFPTITDVQIYFSNTLKLRKLLDIQLYDDISYQINSSPYEVSLVVESRDYQIVASSPTIKQDLAKKMEVLIFVVNLITKTNNLFFTPEDLLQVTEGFYLINFESSSISSQKLFVGFMRWCFEENIEFNKCLQEYQRIPTGMPRPLQQLYENLINGTQFLSNSFVQKELQSMRDKLMFLNGSIDSFYACSYFRKVEKFLLKKQWIIHKKNHEVFLFHLDDLHTCQGKIIRKKRKINLNNQKIIFDPEELEVLYIPENSKIVVRANQFDLEQQHSSSDIEIKYKLPIKFKNPNISLGQNGEIFILQGYLYKYVPTTNKLIQITKRISDDLFVATSRENQYLIIKLSIDIFKNGIKVHYKNEDIIVSLTGDRKMVEQISSLRIDIKSVNFCIQVYRDVYLLMASRNFWILDLNFQCFFSFAPSSRIKKLINNQKQVWELSLHSMIFEIYNQPFSVNFMEDIDQNSVTVTDKHLHVLARIQGKPYYLKYKFLHRMGALLLQGYQALFVSQPLKPLESTKKSYPYQNYHFNFHQESLDTYKFGKWIFSGDQFLKVYDFDIKWQKTNYEVFLKTEKYTMTLKDYLDQVKKNPAQLPREETLLLLYKVYTIFQSLFNRSITHKNFSIQNLCFTKNQKLKLSGWSQPSRNWHISDFKDYLLTCFNIITLESFEKLSQKIIQSHQNKLIEYPSFYDRLNATIKNPKNIEKRTEIQKNIHQFKTYLQKQLCQIFNVIQSNQFIFAFEFSTPRMTMLDIKSQKMKKIVIIPEENAEEFLFSESDKYQWNQERCALYIFTTSYQFFQVKINTSDSNQEKIVVEDYQYLPNNVTDSTFISLGSNLYSFGGVRRSSNNKSSYCTDIYRFNWTTLMWDSISNMPQPRINPKAVISCDKQSIYIIQGLIDHEFGYFRPLKFNIKDSTCEVMIDRSIKNQMPLNPNLPYKIFHLNSPLNIFMFWYIQNGEYIIKYFSCLSTGFIATTRVKNYSQDNSISNLSVSIEDNMIHILRIYGKYTKIIINTLDNANIKNQTLYAI